MTTKAEVISSILFTIVLMCSIGLLLFGGPLWASIVVSFGLSLIVLNGFSTIFAYLKSRITFGTP